MKVMVARYIYFILFIFLLPFVSADNTKVLICLGSNASKYHSGYCRGMKRCTHAEMWVTKSEAKLMGRTPCGYCY